VHFFTKEQWRGWQEPNPTKDWPSIWSRNVRAYQRQLDKLTARLSANALRFFKKCSLHDGRFVSLTVTEAPERAAGRTKGHSTTVELQVMTPGTPRFHYTLRYRDVATIQFDVPSKEPLFLGSSQRVDYWGYDELTLGRKGRLRHEILFSSGSTLLMEFGRFSFVRRKGSRI
jgi:hypothetical protein